MACEVLTALHVTFDEAVPASTRSPGSRDRLSASSRRLADSHLVQERFPHRKPIVDVTTVSSAKRDLLAKLLRGDLQKESATIAAIPRRASDAAAQLSFAQERLWFLDQLMPGSPVFNVPMAVRISHPLDVDALQRTVNEIVRRHEVFRTAFVAHRRYSETNRFG